MKNKYLYRKVLALAVLLTGITSCNSTTMTSFTKVDNKAPALGSSGRKAMAAVSARQVMPATEAEIQVAPTDIRYSLLRGGPGAFGANRGGGKKHAGVDIVANQSNPDKETYLVKAVHAGTVAYARMNGTDETDYGYTVIIDHGTGVYTQYSHLAFITSSGMVKLGDVVSAGTTIGYMANLSLTPPEKSSGNVRADVVRPYDKIQLHFEVFQAEAGRTSTGAIGPIKKEYTLIDPTNAVLSLGYQSF